MEQFSEELQAKKKKQFINRYLDDVMQSDPQSYYASTSDIARQVHVLIGKEISRLALDEQLMLKNLTAKDVEVILSYK